MKFIGKNPMLKASYNIPRIREGNAPG